MSTTTDIGALDHGVPRDTLAMRVLIARHERGLSQRAAALLCGLTFGEWQGIEDGRAATSLDQKVIKIAAGLGYSREWLMWGGPLSGPSNEPGSPMNARYWSERMDNFDLDDLAAA
jgi:transcriptional regulator with XRE-family HTH domain